MKKIKKIKKYINNRKEQMGKRRTSPKLETRENTRELKKKKKERPPAIQRRLASNRNSGGGTQDEDDEGKDGGERKEREGEMRHVG